MRTKAVNASGTVRPTDEQLITITIRGGTGQPLMKGRTIVCPMCELEQDVLHYFPLQYVEKYASFLVVPLKCPSCRHVFALRP